MRWAWVVPILLPVVVTTACGGDDQSPTWARGACRRPGSPVDTILVCVDFAGDIADTVRARGVAVSDSEELCLRDALRVNAELRALFVEEFTTGTDVGDEEAFAAMSDDLARCLPAEALTG